MFELFITTPEPLNPPKVAATPFKLKRAVGSARFSWENGFPAPAALTCNLLPAATVVVPV